MKPDRMTSIPNGKSQSPQKIEAIVMPWLCNRRKR